MCLLSGDKSGRLDRYNVLRPGCSFVLGFYILCSSYCCKFNFNLNFIVKVSLVLNEVCESIICK